MSDNKDWKEQLAEVYKVVSDNQKKIKREHSKFDGVVGRKGMKGFSVAQKLDKLGMRGSHTGELVFENV